MKVFPPTNLATYPPDSQEVNPVTLRPSKAYGVTDHLAPSEAAAYLGVSEQTLAVWRCTKRYPLAYIKVGKLVRYRMRDLQAFLDSRTVSAE